MRLKRKLRATAPPHWRETATVVCCYMTLIDSGCLLLYFVRIIIAFHHFLALLLTDFW